MTAAAFSAGYSDFKLIKTRGVVSISFEIPLKDVDLALRVLGGMPDAAKEQWFGIAALQLNEGVTVAPDLPVEAAGPCGESLDRPRTHRKPVAADKKLATQAAICCSDPVFIKFLDDNYRVYEDEGGTRYVVDYIKTADEAAETVREICKVQSRKEIVPGSEAARKWIDLHGEFLAWKIAA